jgi:hypothetical protein
MHAFDAAGVLEFRAHVRASQAGLRVGGADGIGIAAFARHQRQAQRGDISTVARQRCAFLTLPIA